jgi:hypothetical protein
MSTANNIQGGKQEMHIQFRLETHRERDICRSGCSWKHKSEEDLGLIICEDRSTNLIPLVQNKVKCWDSVNAMINFRVP